MKFLEGPKQKWEGKHEKKISAIPENALKTPSSPILCIVISHLCQKLICCMQISKWHRILKKYVERSHERENMTYTILGEIC